MKLQFLSLYFLLYSIAPLKSSVRESFIMLNPEGSVVASFGDIDTRLTPYCTFNIALSLIGYDLNVLTNESVPQWEYTSEYDASRPECCIAQTPTSWIKNSCVWYSKLLAAQIGRVHMQQYLSQFDYGNQDFSAPDAWLNASLNISPREHVLFLQKMIKHSLPVSRHAFDMTKNIIFIEQLANGWHLFGKTGGGDMTTTGGTYEIGLLVGWVEKGTLAYPFAYVIQDTKIVYSERIVRVRQLLQEYL